MKTPLRRTLSAAFVIAALSTVAPNPLLATSSFGWFYYQMGDVTTKVDGISEYSDTYYPVGYDLLGVDQEIYFQIGMDIGGRWLYDVVSTFIFNDHLTLDEQDYGMDESFCNIKGGVFRPLSTGLGFGYGGDLDWRVNKYQDVEGATANSKKTRVGFGPNVGLRVSPFSWITFFPNISGYFYPWPNKDYAFIPKSLDSFGYRAEFPLNIDLVDALTGYSNAALVVSAMPFIGAKSGFYSSNDQTGEVKNATASELGIKFGLFGWF